MSSDLETVYLITGAGRGIGAAISRILLDRHNAHVIICVRDITSESVQQLKSQYQNKVTIVKIDSAKDETASLAAKDLKKQGIKHIDVVVANAGIVSKLISVDQMPIDELREAIQINTIAPLVLFQTFKPFLLERQSESTSSLTQIPKFVIISSLSGSINQQGHSETYPLTSYAMSKVAVNMLSKRISIECPRLISWCLHPGLVLTDMTIGSVGRQAMQRLIEEGSAITTEDSAKRIVAQIDDAQLESHSGRFFNVQDGKQIAW